MTPIDFNESNHRFGPPPEMNDAQCGTLFVHKGEVPSGSLEGTPIIVSCWIPTPAEREMIAEGHPIYLTILGTGQPPVALSTSFHQASNL